MEITWLGHSCFRIKGKEAIIIVDPCPPATGYSPGKLQADIVTISHADPGHSAADAVQGAVRVIKGPGEYEIKLSLDVMQTAGVPVREVRAIGGGARSELWLQTKADIWGKPVVAMDVSEAPCLGCAILAGVATGAFPTVGAGIAQMVRTRRTYEPDLGLHERYMEKAWLYGQIYPALAALNHQM